MEILLLVIVLIFLVVIKTELSGNRKELRQLDENITSVRKDMANLLSETFIKPKQKEESVTAVKPEEIIIEKPEPEKEIPKFTEPRTIEKEIHTAEERNFSDAYNAYTKKLKKEQTEIVSPSQPQPANIYQEP